MNILAIHCFEAFFYVFEGLYCSAMTAVINECWILNFSLSNQLVLSDQLLPWCNVYRRTGRGVVCLLAAVLLLRVGGNVFESAVEWA